MLNITTYTFDVTPSIEERFWAKVQPDDDTGCWNWMAYRNATGYGKFTIRGTVWFAHRASYVIAHGEIPDGLTIDHLCRNTACVNPSHLEPVTTGVNTLRGAGLAAINARKPHCAQGHEYTPENTITSEQYPNRICRTCSNKYRREWRARQPKPNKVWVHPRSSWTHCVNGHEFDEANTHIRTNGTRSCRACGRDDAKRRRRKAAALKG